MSTKSFKHIPKPGRQPSADEIAGFEATGRAGHKLHPDAAVIAETQKSVSPETRLSSDAGTRESANPESRNDATAETRKPVTPDTQEPVNAETHEHGDTEILVRAEPIVRLTVDLPESAHLRFKAACALSRRTMVQEVRDLIERRTAEMEGRGAFT